MSDAPAAQRRNGGNGGGFPFGQYERMLAIRYLFATRKDGGVALMSVIAFVGVMLAVAALIAVMSIMNGFREELLSRLLGIDGHIYVQTVDMPMDVQMAQDVAAALRDVPGVEAAYPLVLGEGLAGTPVSGSRPQLALVRGMTPRDIAETDFIRESLVNGGSDAFGEGLNGGNVIYAGRGLAELLGVGVGDALNLLTQGPNTIMGTTPRSKPYVIGDYVDTGLEDYNRAIAYMPLDQAQLFFNKDGMIDHVEVRIADADAVEPIRAQIQRTLGTRYLVTDWRDARASLFNALQVERGAMRLILMLVVLIAALNIISGFTMLVRDKARDIAILRTVGVEKGSVMRVFLMSGFMLGGLGTLAGLALGVLFSVYIAPIQGAVEAVCRCEVFAADVYGLGHLPALVDWGEVAVISGWGFAVSVLVTLIPAWFAARLDPVEALRYE